MAWDAPTSILQPRCKGEELIIVHHLHHANLFVQGANMANRLHHITGTWRVKRVLPVIEFASIGISRQYLVALPLYGFIWIYMELYGFNYSI